MVRILLDLKASIKKKDDFGLTPYDYAKKNGH
jgi:ankyrin repeat protein